MALEYAHLAIVIPEQNVVSESFIGSHIEGLFSDPTVIWGSPRPLFLGDGESVLTGFSRTAASALDFAWRVGSERANSAIGRRLPDRLYSKALARFLRRNGVEVVLAEYGPTGVVLMNACVRSATPLVVHFHGYDAYQTEILDRMRESYARLFDLADRVVAVSHHMVSQLRELGAPPERILYNPYGIDVDLFRGGRPAGTPPIFLALGRFVDKKAPTLTIRAFAEVHGAEPASRLVMLGDGPLREASIELTRELGIEDSVSFLGSVEHSAVVGWMQRARCFVQHSLRAADGDSEGTPVAVLEASSCGLPVVSTRHAGIAEAVRDGKSGFLVEEGDVDGMAAFMLRLVREPELAETMGAAGRRHVKTNYSSETSLGRLRSVLIEAARSSA